MAPLFGGKDGDPGRDALIAAEAVQALEHAALIRISWQGGGQHCMATRRGRAAAEQGTVGEILSAGL